VTLSAPCYPGAPDTEVCGGSAGEFFWASIESETPPRDTNWYSFTAEEGWEYTISAFGFIDEGDVAQISLYDGGAVVATDDSSDASGLPFPDAEIIWTAPKSGAFLVRFFQPLELAKVSLTGQIGIHGEAPQPVITTPPVTPEPEVTPTPTPTEVPIVQCPVTNISGWFEPVQGVWQDDYTFKDLDGKQLDGPFVGASYPEYYYEAELDMVAGRDTLLFGIRGSTDPLNDPKRWVIQIAGNTTGTIPVPVHFEFFLDGIQIERDPGLRTLMLDAPLGECGPVTPFEEKLDAVNGIPHSEPFKISAGDYILDAELRRGTSESTGIIVSVKGTSVEVPGLDILFAPMWLNPRPTTQRGLTRGSRSQTLGENHRHRRGKQF